MPSKKITALTSLGAAPATGDKIPIVDVSDTTDASTGTTKHVLVSDLTGISDRSLLVANAAVADNDFLKIDGTSVEGRSAAEVLSDISGVSSANIVGVQDMWVPAAAMRPTTTAGCAAIADLETTATRPDIQTLDFDSSTQEYAQFSVAMPKSWNAGVVTAQFYWTHATAVATDVIWAIQGVCASDNDTIDVAYGTAVTVTDTFHNAAEDLAITAATGDVTLGGSPAAGDLAFFQVYRDADAAGDDTNSTDAKLIGVKINYTTSALNDA